MITEIKLSYLDFWDQGDFLKKFSKAVPSPLQVTISELFPLWPLIHIYYNMSALKIFQCAKFDNVQWISIPFLELVYSQGHG